MAFSSVPQTGPTFTEHPLVEDVFQPFPRLPPEIRNKIWSFYLADATRQMYRFSLRYPIRSQVKLPKNCSLPGDELFLEPTFTRNKRYAGTSAGLDFLQPLKESTNTRRIASATCVQSRQVVLELFPDTLPFRHFPSKWGWWMHVAEFPEYISCASMAQRISSSSTQTGRTKRPSFKSQALEVPRRIASQESAT